MSVSGTRIQLHSSLTIISKELSVFLGRENHDLLSLLTDLYDCPNRWEYKTKNKGIDTITGVWLNMLAASTPTWLVGSVPVTAIGGGFTSRVIFVVEKDVRKRVPIPYVTDEEKRIRDDLEHDLEAIGLISGPFELDPMARNIYEKWYETSEDAKFTDHRFSGYSERKHIHILKVAMLVAISEGSEGRISLSHLNTAMSMINAVEPNMIEAFGAAGRSPLGPDIGFVLDTIEAAGGEVRKDDLLKGIYKDVDVRVFDNIMQTLYEMGKIDIIQKEGSKPVYKLKEKKGS